MSSWCFYAGQMQVEFLVLLWWTDVCVGSPLFAVKHVLISDLVWFIFLELNDIT